MLSQFQQDVIKNKFPAERDTYIRLTGLMAQVQSMYTIYILCSLVCDNTDGVWRL